jgi:ATP-binding cassette subfamily F protein uup
VAILISANNIGKTFGARPLFEGLTFVIDAGERIGLIGPNGAGKSTLLNIMALRQSVDTGDLSIQRGLKIGFLEQTPKLPLQSTVEEAVLSGSPDPDEYEAMALSHELLSKLDLEPFSKYPVERLSGGWKKRVALARELMREPELLLLDEPTNHLDIESILWLESFLEKSRFATITVTHDRLFLQRVANRILEVDKRNPQGLLSVIGDYATYLERKDELLQNQRTQEEKLQNRLRRETEWLRRGPKARTTKQQARIQAAETLKEEVSELEFRNQSRTARIDFQSSEKKPKRLIEAKSITKSFGGRPLFKNLELFIGPGSRLGLLGHNGCGKSTLIKVLLGMEAPDTGEVFRSEHLNVAYFEQNREALDPEKTLRHTLCPSGDHVNYRGKMVHIAGYLDRFLFRKEQFDMPLGRLSGGEQSRVLIAKLMLKESNVLILDEPTNDLDVETLDILQDCLTDFDGAVLLVTHDRYFLDQVATEIHAFPSGADEPGKVISFAGLAQWEDWHRQRLQERKSGGKAATSPSGTDEKKKRKLGFNETRELSLMEGNIQKAEAKLGELEAETQLPVNQSNAARLAELYQEITKAQGEIERLYARWAELEAMTKA